MNGKTNKRSNYFSNYHFTFNGYWVYYSNSNVGIYNDYKNRF